jgi:hypothetical protein
MGTLATIWDPTNSESAALAYGALTGILFLAVLHFILRSAQRSAHNAAVKAARDAKAESPPELLRSRQGLGALIVGQDNRLSTSKVQVALWTTTIVWAILVLVYRFTGSGSNLNDAFAIQGEYLILLGFPATAGIVAKVLTTTRVANGDLDKPLAESPSTADIVSNDDGVADLGDCQYFLFNLVALALFYRLFIAEIDNGLPALPETIVALTGASAAVYVAKKTQERDKAPTIAWVRPAVLEVAAGTEFTVSGDGFIAPDDEAPNPPSAASSEAYWLSLGGVPMELVGWEKSRITARLPVEKELKPMVGKSQAALVVYNTRARASEPTSVELASP